ncbi:MAG: hypothetical protein KF780_11710 [Sphingomonas sp.]|nr:hypothetical protein [Sphingomonas sp.]
MGFYLKDPQSRVDYAIDWGGYMDGQAIAESIWSATPDEAGGIVVEAASFDLNRSAARIAGGLAGRVYSVANRVTMSDGSVDERSITLRVEER